MKKGVEIELSLANKVGATDRHSQEEGYFEHVHLNHEETKRLKDLEGQCKITQFQYLQINYPKAIALGVLMTISVFGLILLKYYKSLRAKLFYDYLQPNQIPQATHVYVKGTDRVEQICEIQLNNLEEASTRVFQFKHLKYEIIEGQPFPLTWHYEQKLEYCISEKFLKEGLSRFEAEKREIFYGRNQHRVEVPGYFQFLFDTMTKPFFLFQYFVCTIYILENAVIFGVMMIFFSWFTTTVNYLLLRRSYQQIKQTAEKQFRVKVLRNGNYYYISNIDLVPGDLYEPGEETPCDSIVVKGELFVDEASLTGQNVPIPKFKLRQPEDKDMDCHRIWQGSKIQTMKEHTLALAVNVGYASRRGRIIRKILTKVPRQPEIFSKLIYFLFESCIVTTILFLATLGMMLNTDIERILVLFRFFDYICASFQAAYPIYFNLAYSFCLVRLHRDGILGTQCERTVESGRLKTLCFDKTGTLTQAKMKVCNIFHIIDHNNLSEVTKELGHNDLISSLFGCCNSVEMINGEPKGDEIDLQLFLHSEGRIEFNQKSQVIRNIVIGQNIWEILKIHQYQSKFQSMSVVAREVKSQKCYVFVKGSPEMIHDCSDLKYKKYEEFIKRLSLEGYRSIAFGYEEVQKDRISSYINMERDELMNNIRILGVVTFINLLKEDASETVFTLNSCGINTKIITGDNIFLGIQTAILTGMIPTNATIAVLEGKKFNEADNTMDVLYLSKDNQGNFAERKEKVSPFYFENKPNLYYAIDNDFIRNRQDFLHNKIKVFARISPQNKAAIIRKHKEIYESWRKAGSFCQRLFRDCGFRVGMVGDGANDLIAIKDADVGIGIQSTDAVYSADFAVQSLTQINQIIRQAKNTERQLMEIVQYFGACSLIGIVQTVILTKDATFPTSIMYLYRNFIAILIITLFLGVSRPAQKLSKYLVTTNFMGFEHHLVYWGNVAIGAFGLTISYVYYQNSSDFEPNPKPVITFAHGANGLCKSTTIVFLCSIIIYVFLVLFVYRSRPWKQPIYQNKALLITVVVNILLIIPIFFLTKHLSFMDLVEIGQKEAAICLLIMLITMALIWLYNSMIERQGYHEKEQMYLEGMPNQHLSDNKSGLS